MSDYNELEYEYKLRITLEENNTKDILITKTQFDAIDDYNFSSDDLDNLLRNNGL